MKSFIPMEPKAQKELMSSALKAEFGSIFMKIINFIRLVLTSVIRNQVLGNTLLKKDPLIMRVYMNMTKRDNIIITQTKFGKHRQLSQ